MFPTAHDGLCSRSNRLTRRSYICSRISVGKFWSADFRLISLVVGVSVLLLSVVLNYNKRTIGLRPELEEYTHLQISDLATCSIDYPKRAVMRTCCQLRSQSGPWLQPGVSLSALGHSKSSLPMDILNLAHIVSCWRKISVCNSLCSRYRWDPLIPAH
jgi:hypothetical protein